VIDPVAMLVVPLGEAPGVQFEDPIVLSLIKKEKGSIVPIDKLKHLFYVMVVTIIFLLIRGSPKYGSIVGISACGTSYWIANGIYLVISFSLAYYFAINQFKIQEENAKFGL
jgi:hypothetical protein